MNRVTKRAKVAIRRSWTFIWLTFVTIGTAIVEMAPWLLSVLQMPELSQLVSHYKPGWSLAFVAIVGALTRLRSIKPE